MRSLYLVLVVSIGVFLLIFFNQPVDNTELEQQLTSGVLIKNQMIKQQQKQAKYFIAAYPDYEVGYKNGLKRDSLFFVYQNNKSNENRKNYLVKFQPQNEYQYDYRQLDFSVDELQFLTKNSKYRNLSNQILDSKMNNFRYISWTFQMMEILGSKITFDKYQPMTNQSQVFYENEKIELPIFLGLSEIEAGIPISKIWLNDKLLPNNQMKIKANEIGQQQFEIKMEGDKFGKMSRTFEFMVE